MSVRVSTWVWHDVDSAVMGNELVLLLALADVADDDGRCTYGTAGSMTYEGLAAKVRVSRSTIIRMVSKLRERDLLEHDPGSKGSENRFRLRVPWAQVSGVNLEPNAPDAVSDGALFGSKSDGDSSYRRVNGGTREPKGKAHPLPADWVPSAAHIVNARERGLDLEFEAMSFRLHAEANDRRAVRWDAAFSQWLLKARSSVGAAVGAQSSGDEWLDALR